MSVVNQGVEVVINQGVGSHVNQGATVWSSRAWLPFELSGHKALA